MAETEDLVEEADEEHSANVAEDDAPSPATSNESGDDADDTRADDDDADTGGDVAAIAADQPLADATTDELDPDDRHIGDYGIDAPHIVGGIAWLAAGTLLATIVAGILNARPLMFYTFVASAFLTLFSLVFVRSSRVGKVEERAHIVDHLELEGTERVLDIGCGRGLLIVEMASRLVDDDALAVGVDIWRTRDESRNHPEAVYENAELEGCDDVVEVGTADARRLPFPAECFDAVTSSMTLHHITDFEGRLSAIREIDRVTARGARVVLVDFRYTKAYLQALRACNWVDLSRSRRVWRMFPPVRYVTGAKPIERRRASRLDAEGNEVIVPEGDAGPIAEEEAGAADSDVMDAAAHASKPLSEDEEIELATEAEDAADDGDEVADEDADGDADADDDDETDDDGDDETDDDGDDETDDDAKT